MCVALTSFHAPRMVYLFSYHFDCSDNLFNFFGGAEERAPKGRQIIEKLLIKSNI